MDTRPRHQRFGNQKQHDGNGKKEHTSRKATGKRFILFPAFAIGAEQKKAGNGKRKIKKRRDVNAVSAVKYSRKEAKASVQKMKGGSAYEKKRAACPRIACKTVKAAFEHTDLLEKERRILFSVSFFVLKIYLPRRGDVMLFLITDEKIGDDKPDGKKSYTEEQSSYGEGGKGGKAFVASHHIRAEEHRYD